MSKSVDLSVVERQRRIGVRPMGVGAGVTLAAASPYRDEQVVVRFVRLIPDEIWELQPTSVARFCVFGVGRGLADGRLVRAGDLLVVPAAAVVKLSLQAPRASTCSRSRWWAPGWPIRRRTS
jgi:hypothetical protein